MDEQRARGHDEAGVAGVALAYDHTALGDDELVGRGGDLGELAPGQRREQRDLREQRDAGRLADPLVTLEHAAREVFAWRVELPAQLLLGRVGVVDLGEHQVEDRAARLRADQAAALDAFDRDEKGG